VLALALSRLMPVVLIAYSAVSTKIYCCLHGLKAPIGFHTSEHADSSQVIKQPSFVWVVFS
jgi:hypothetical protein